MVQENDENANNTQRYPFTVKLRAKIKAPITPIAVPNHLNTEKENEFFLKSANNLSAFTYSLVKLHLLVHNKFMKERPDQFLRHLFKVAVNSVSAELIIPKNLPEKPKGKTIIVGAGKASASMAKALEETWEGPLTGIVVVPYDYKEDTQNIIVMEAGHPIPDEQSAKASRRLIQSISSLNAEDLVIALISGGGSAALSLPAKGITLAEKQLVNQALLQSGASITEINSIRQILSGIKGGRLAVAARPARIHTLIVSDVVGDNPGVVASGPTLPMPYYEPVTEILERYKLDLPSKLNKFLTRDRDVIKQDKSFQNDTVKIIGRSKDAMNAAANEARARGWDVVLIGDSIKGEAKNIAYSQAKKAIEIARFRNASSPPLVLLSGGEVTVSLGGLKGYGGPNTEFLLALGLMLNSEPKIWALACDTDGIDGNSKNAGAVLTPYSISGAIELGLDPTGLLTAHRSGTFFDALGHNIVTGPTLTNVNDFRAIAICAGAY